MDLRQMKYFTTIVEQGTISKAAKVLHMAQPPLSIQLKQLEDELGVVLVKRGNHQIELTQAGTMFYKRCLQILDLSEIARNEMKQSYQEVLRIGITSSNSALIQKEKVKQFIHEHHHLSYSIHEGSTYEMLDLDDPLGLAVGYITRCCFLIDGASRSALYHSAQSKDGRIFVVRKDGELVDRKSTRLNSSH